MPGKERRNYTDDFKNQMVQLYLNGKPRKTRFNSVRWW